MSESDIKELRELKELVTDIHKRLFYDNGTLSFQTRLSNHAQQLKLVYWVGGVGLAAIISAIIKLWLRA